MKIRFRGILGLISIVFLVWVSDISASRLNKIKLVDLPQNPTFQSGFKELLSLEPYIERWQQNWQYNIEKEKVQKSLERIYNNFVSIEQNYSLNGELQLVLGLTAHFAHNLDLSNISKKVEAHFANAQELMKNDYRPSWFLGKYLYESAKPKEGVLLFIDLEEKYTIADGEFWEDYFECAYLSQMLYRSIVCLDKANSLLGRKSKFEDLIGYKIRNKLKYPVKSEIIPFSKIFFPRKQDNVIHVTSFALGYRITYPATWITAPTEFRNKAAIFSMKMPEKDGITGKAAANMVMLAYVADEQEDINEYMKRYMNKYFDYSQIDLGMGLNEISYSGFSDEVYAQEGGARTVILGFERNEPVNSGLILEKANFNPMEITLTTGLRLNSDTMYYRFKGKLFYILLLDCSDSIYSESFEEFKKILSSLIVE